MTSSDDFRKQLKAGNITEALALALSKAVELKITTWVASESDTFEASQAKPGHSLRTRINTIEGKIENEIGDQFIGNGPYRELRQFHLDQVAEGNKIIQSNLKSLQKVFEVLVTLRYQAATPPVVEPESFGGESQLLPPVDEVSEHGLIIESQELVSGDAVSGDAVSGDAVISSNPLSEGMIAELDEEPNLFRRTSADSEEALGSEADDEEDWDDSVLDLLESLPVVPPPNRQALDSQQDEDRRDFIEEPPDHDPIAPDSLVNENWETLTREDFESPLISPEPNSEVSTSHFEQDWGDFIGQEPEHHPIAPESPVNQERETLTQEDFERLPILPESDIDASSSVIDADRAGVVREEPPGLPTAADLLLAQDGETLIQQESELPPTSPEPSIDAPSSETDEDWGWEDLVVQEQLEPEPAVPESLVNQHQGITQEDSESPSTLSAPGLEILDSEINEDWGDFLEEEPEPTSAVPESAVNQGRGTLTPKEFDSPPSLPASNVEASQPVINEDWGDLLEQEPQPNQDRQIPSLDSLSLEGDEEWDDWVVEEPEPLQDTAIVDMELLDLGEDQDWGDFADESNPFDALPAPTDSASGLELDDDWDDFATDELESYSAFPDLHSTEASTEQGEKGSPEELKRSSKTPEMTNQPQTGSEREVLSKNSDSLIKSEDDLDAKPKPVEKRVPPPPPSHLPSQNNEK
ncbi:MAG TPA: hypothetical protein V6D14_20125 [Coleofasciculaceae cyanobacterium]|jgi:hypothetical protein